MIAMSPHLPRNITSTRNNPFCNNLSLDRLTTWQKIQIYFMSVTVAPVRFLLFFISFLITWFFSTLFTINFTIKDKPGPVRAVSFRFLRYLGRVTLYFMGFQYVQVVGRRCTTEEAPILVYAPHSSFMDSIVFFLQSPFPSPVSRLENYHLPLLHTLLKVVRPIFVSREDPNSRQTTIQEVKKRSTNEDAQIGIFPEGTCTNRTALITFKCGAFIPGVPVQPVCVEYFHNYDYVSWVEEGPGGPTLAWLGMCQWNISCRITYLSVYVPNEQERKDPRLFADNVRNVMANAMNISCADYSFDDSKLMRIAESYNIPMYQGLIGFRHLNYRFGLTVEQTVSMMTEYCEKLHNTGRCQMTVQDFAECHQMEVTPQLEETFNICCTDGTGTIIAREYIMLHMLINLPVTEDAASLRAVFRCLDTDQDGRICAGDFYQFMDGSVEGYVDVAKLHAKIDTCLPSTEVDFEGFQQFALANREILNLLRWCPKCCQAFSRRSSSDSNTVVSNGTVPVEASPSTESLKHRIVSTAATTDQTQ